MIRNLQMTAEPDPMTANATMTDDTLFTRPAALVEQRLHALLEECQLPPDLLAASQYGVLGGGKRLRPALVVLSCESVEGDANSMPAAACAGTRSLLQSGPR